MSRARNAARHSSSRSAPSTATSALASRKAVTGKSKRRQRRWRLRCRRRKSNRWASLHRQKPKPPKPRLLDAFESALAKFTKQFTPQQIAPESLTWLLARPKMRRQRPRSRNDRSKNLALSDNGEAGRRRDGCGLQGRRHQTRPLCCIEIPAERDGKRSCRSGKISARGARCLCVESPQHLHHLRNRRI